MYQGDHCLHFTDWEADAQASQLTSASVTAPNSSKSHLLRGRCQAALVCLQVPRSPHHLMPVLRTDDRKRARLANPITWASLARVPVWHLDPEQEGKRRSTRQARFNSLATYGLNNPLKAHTPAGKTEAVVLKVCVWGDINRTVRNGSLLGACWRTKSPGCDSVHLGPTKHKLNDD